MNTLPAFVPFPKIPRLNREVIVTEKIDGTNAVVHVSEDGSVIAGSRSRWLVDGEENQGFAYWVKEHEGQLKHLGPGTHWGEWWGRGIQRRYGLEERRFSLFNVHGVARPECCHVVPVLATGTDIRAAVEEGLARLRGTGSIAALGFMQPEGVVAFHTASGHMFKVLLEGDELPKGKHQ